MMLSLGTDIVSVKRIGKAYKKFGNKFVKRILTERELQTFEKRKNKIEFLASRFAAKEAVYKAYQLKPFSWHRIEIQNSGAKPEVSIDGEKMESISLSISHEKDFAVAFCIYIKEKPR